MDATDVKKKRPLVETTALHSNHCNNWLFAGELLYLDKLF